MKKLLFSLLFFVATNSHAQIDKAVDDKIKAFASTLDSAFVVDTSASGTFIVDKISVPVNTVKGFSIQLTGVQSGKFVFTTMALAVCNNNGIYSVQAKVLVPPSGLLTGINWTAFTTPGQTYATVQIMGNTSKTNWEYKRY